MIEFYTPQHRVMLACMQMMRMHLDTTASYIKAQRIMEGW